MTVKPAMPAPGPVDGPIAALVISSAEPARLSLLTSIGERIRFYARAEALSKRLDRETVSAVVIETRDTDGFPVPAAIQPWVRRNPHVPVIVWTGGGETALREVLALGVEGGDIRLVLRGRDDLALTVERLLTRPTEFPPGAVPAILQHVVAASSHAIQPDLTLAAYHAWPHPSVAAWALSLHVTRQALNSRLEAAHLATASVVLDAFSAAEIAIRCAMGSSLRHIAAAMGRLDDRSLRRRLKRLWVRPEQLRDEADFRALLPRILLALKRPPAR
jgi:hypothetical protein